jgi:gas vesicle protein
MGLFWKSLQDGAVEEGGRTIGKYFVRVIAMIFMIGAAVGAVTYLYGDIKLMTTRTLMGPIAVTKQKVTDIKERAADIKADIKDVAVDKAHDAATAVRNAGATAVDRTREAADNAKEAATDKAQRIKGGIAERWRLWRNRNTSEEEEPPPQ